VTVMWKGEWTYLGHWTVHEHRPFPLGRILMCQGRIFGPVESKVWTEGRVVFLDWNELALDDAYIDLIEENQGGRVSSKFLFQMERSG